MEGLCVSFILSATGIGGPHVPFLFARGRHPALSFFPSFLVVLPSPLPSDREVPRVYVLPFSSDAAWMCRGLEHVTLTYRRLETSSTENCTFLFFSLLILVLPSSLFVLSPLFSRALFF